MSKQRRRTFWSRRGTTKVGGVVEVTEDGIDIIESAPVEVCEKGWSSN